MSLSLNSHKQGGFTLIELMVVMAIIAILATAGLSAYTGYIKKARDTTRAQDMHKIYRMILEYNTLYGKLPKTVSYSDYNDGGWDSSSKPIGSPTFMNFLVTSGITTRVPMDPVNNGWTNGTVNWIWQGYTYLYYCYENSGTSLGYISEVTGQVVWHLYYSTEFKNCS